MVHDESTFYANADQTRFWNDGEAQVLRQKSLGSSIMVSDIMVEGKGYLEDENDSARLYLETNKDGYFNNDMFIKQVTCAIDIFERKFPHTTGIFLLPRAHAQRGKVIGSVVVVVVVSTKIARSRILGEFASANCSDGVINRKKTRERASRLSKRDHESYKSCFLLVTPISHTHSNYLHMHAERSRTRTLAIDQYS